MATDILGDEAASAERISAGLGIERRHQPFTYKQVNDSQNSGPRKKHILHKALTKHLQQAGIQKSLRDFCHTLTPNQSTLHHPSYWLLELCYPKLFITTTKRINMPLIIPGMQGNDASTTENSTQQWLTKLAGKKLGEKHDETVCWLI